VSGSSRVRHLYGLSLQTVTAGKGRDALKLKSTLTLFGLESKYVNFTAIRYVISPLATKNITNQISLKENAQPTSIREQRNIAILYHDVTKDNDNFNCSVNFRCCFTCNNARRSNNSSSPCSCQLYTVRMDGCVWKHYLNVLWAERTKYRKFQKTKGIRSQCRRAKCYPHNLCCLCTHFFCHRCLQLYTADACSLTDSDRPWVCGNGVTGMV